MPNTTERLSLILDARVADFENGLRRAEDALGKLATQAQRSGGDFQQSVDQSINAAQKSLNNLGRSKGAEDLRDLFSRAKQSAAAFQKDFERIQRDLVRTQEQANKALIKAQQDLAVAQGQSQRDIEKAREEGAKRQQQILDQETAAEKKAKQAQLDAINQFNAAQKAAAQQRLQTLDSLSKQEAAFRTRGIRPNRRERAVLDAQKRDQEERQQILRRERELIERRRGIQAAAADPGADRIARRGLVKAEREITALIEQERERRISITQRIDAREIQIRENAAAKAAAVEKRIEGRNFGLARAQADADERIRISQAVAARDAAVKKAGDTLAQESANKRKKVAQDAARTEEDIQKRLERLEARRRQIIKANIGALDAAKGAEDKYQGELSETANKIRELTAALEALRQRRADAARAGLDRIGAPPPGGGGRAGGRGGGGLGQGPSPASAAGALRDLNSSVNRLRIGILNIQTALGLVGASFGIKESLDLASQFERELASINTLLVNAQVPIERYRDQLVQLSVESSKDLIDLTQGLYQTVSAGIPAIEGAAGAFELLVQAQKAAVAGNATTRQSVNALITTVKAYEATGISAAEASDKLFTTVRLGRTTFEELSSTIGRILGITANFGLSLDESLAAVATITRVIPSTAESITQLRALIRGIVRPAKQVSALLADINERTGAQLEFSAKALREQGLSGIIEQILEVTGGDPDILARLFPNVRALGGAAVLTASTFRDFVDALDQLKNSAGATDVALGKVQNTLQEQSRILRSRFQKVLIEIGEKSFPLIKEALVDIGNFLEDNQDTFQTFFSGILVSARDLFTFLRDNFNTIVKVVEGFLLVRFPLAFAAFKGLIAAEGEGFGAIGNALILGLTGAGVLKAFGVAGAQLGAAVVARFTPVVATGIGGAVRTGLAAIAGGLAGALVSLIGPALIIGIGSLINLATNEAQRQLADVAEGRRDSLGLVGRFFSDQKDRDRAAAAAKEKLRVETLAQVYDQAAKAAQAAGIAVADFYEILEKNRGDLDKTVDAVRKSLEGAQALAISGDILQIEPGAFDRVFRAISEEAQKTQGDVLALEEALVELRTGAGLGERGKAIFDQARSELGAAANRPAFTGPGGTSVQVEDTAAIQRRAVEIAQAELQARRQALTEFNEDELRAQVRQQELVVQAYKAQLEKARADLAVATDSATRTALEGTIDTLTQRLANDLEPSLQRLAERLPDAIGAGDIINRSEFEQGIFEAVKRAAEAGELSLARVIRTAPRLSAASTFGQLLQDQAAAQAEAIQFLSEKAADFQKELERNQKKLDEGGITDRQRNEFRDNIRKVREDLEASNSLLARVEQGIATPAEIATARFEAFGAELGLSVDSARELADEIGKAFSEGRYAEGLKALQTANGEVTDIAGALRLWALRQKEINESTDGYEGIEQRLLAAQKERAVLQQQVAEAAEARAKAEEAGSEILTKNFEELLQTRIKLLGVQEQTVKQLEKERDSSLQLFKNTEALIDRLFAFLLRQQPSLVVDKAAGQLLDRVRAIAAFDREAELIRLRRQREDTEIARERLELENEILKRNNLIANLKFEIDFRAAESTEVLIERLQTLRQVTAENVGAVTRFREALLDLQSVQSSLTEQEQALALDRLREDADMAVLRATIQRQEAIAREVARVQNELGRKNKKDAKLFYAQAVAQVNEDIKEGRLPNIAPASFIEELRTAYEELIIAVQEKRFEDASKLLNELEAQNREAEAQFLAEDLTNRKRILEKQEDLLRARQDLRGARLTAVENELEYQRTLLQENATLLKQYVELATSADPLARALSPGQLLDESQRLLTVRSRELDVLKAQADILAFQERQSRNALDTALENIDLERAKLELENIPDDVRSQRTSQLDLQVEAAEQTFRAALLTTAQERERLALAQKRLILETSVLPTAAAARATNQIADAFFNRLKDLLPSLFVTGAELLFGKINEGVLALEEFFEIDLPSFFGDSGDKLVITDRFGTTLKDVVVAVNELKTELTGDSNVSPDLLGNPGEAATRGFLVDVFDALALSVRKNVFTGIPSKDPNANVPGPAFRPVIASAIGPVLTAYTQAVELVTEQLIRGAEVFSAKVVEPLLNVSLVGIDRLLDSLQEALGILTDLSQEFTGQVIRRPPQGSDIVAIRREAASQRFAEQRARAAGLVQETRGQGSATGRAVRALEKAAKDALKLTERIIEGLPTVIDKFLDLLIERGPELLEKAGDALVIVVRKLLQRLPEIVRALAPVLADIVINLVEEIINQLPQIIEAFAALLNTLLIKSGELFGRVITSLVRNFDEIIKSIVRAFPQILSGLIVGVAAGVAEAVVSVLKGLIPGSGGFSGTLFGAGLGAIAGSFIPGIGTLVGAGIGGLLGSFFHDGGEVKAGQRNRAGARAMLAAGAGRYRTGGIVLPSVSDYLSQQLRGDEVPAVLQVGERVLSRRQVGALGGQSGIDDLIANRGQQPMSVESNVVLSYDKSNDPITDTLMSMLLPRLQVRGTTNVNQNPRTVGSRPARGRGI